MKEFKIKSPIETYQMIICIDKSNNESFKEILDYIQQLECNLSTYQMALDHIRYSIDTHNVNVTR